MCDPWMTSYLIFLILCDQITTAMDGKALRRLQEQAEIHRSLHDHPSIIKVHGMHQRSSPSREFTLLLEKGEGSLRDIIQPTEEMKPLRQRLLHTKDIHDIIHDIFDGVTYIHSRTDDVSNMISHRDIKPENIIVVPQKRDGSFAIKFTDFDSAKQMDEDDHVKITGGVMTPLYQDPNLVGKRSKDVSADDYAAHDVYATALVTFELLGNGKHLFKGSDDHDTIHKMRNNDRENLLNAEIDGLAKNLIWTMTQPCPEDRITIKQAKSAPYFDGFEQQIQGLGALNEAIIELGDSEKGKTIRKELNDSFFMLLQGKWKELPFVFPEILKGSKYSDGVDAYLRYCRNLIFHAGQYEELLQQKYGRLPSSNELLQMILKHTPGFVINFYWISARHFELKFTENFPPQCVKAYEEQIKAHKQKIHGNLEGLRRTVGIESLDSANPSDNSTVNEYNAIVDEFFSGSHKQIQRIIEKTESNFKSLKADLKKWDREKARLQETVAQLTKNHKPPSEVEVKCKELAQVEKMLEARWIIEYRDCIRNPYSFRESKKRNGSLLKFKSFQISRG